MNKCSDLRLGTTKNSDLYGTGPLRPDIHEVQKGPTGEQETQWIRRTNRQITILNDASLLSVSFQ